MSHNEELSRIEGILGAGRRKRGLVLVVVLALCAGFSGAWWWMDRESLINHDEKEELQALAAKAAVSSGRTPQAVWIAAKRDLGVARIEEIRRKQMDMARQALLRQR
ncbi:MAG: hypothetical protein HQL56_08140 [Magnetococcales bacterium]|nr:hypothetical protein [Magnetococcales bacterium]